VRLGAQRELDPPRSQRGFENAETVTLPLGGDVGQDMGEEVARERRLGWPTGPALAKLVGRAEVHWSIQRLGKHGVATTVLDRGFSEEDTQGK
jgi:hypothetical protein